MLAIHGCGGHQFALEAHRRSVTEGRMSAASIVPTFDPFKDRQLRLDLRAKVAPIEQLTFQRGEKRFGHGVVVRISDRTNGWHDAHFAAALAEGEARVLRAVIGMMNHSVLGPALCERHVDGREHQLSFQMIFHRPADDFARACIQHDRQEQKPRPRRKWSERPGVVELFPGLSAPNRTCTFPRIRLSISSVAHSKDKISVTRFKDTALLFAQDVRVAIRQPPFELTLPARHQSPQRDFSEGSATIRTR